MPILDTVLGANGALARNLAGFVPRRSQQRMAARVGEALAARELLMVEAGTGTGKTFAYLVPALLSGLRILISTGTRTLQDQLYNRDLPLLAGALGRPARIALLKGRGNYLCRSRLAAVGQQSELLQGEADALFPALRDWSLITRSGDLAEVTELGEVHPLRAQITSTRESCTGSQCSEFARCHVFDARRTALEADIVVVNHHLLLADLALKEDGFGDLLPSVDAFILDEAHQLPDLAAEFFGVGVSSRQIQTLLQDLRREINPTRGTRAQAAQIVTTLEQALRLAVSDFTRTEERLAWRDVPPAARSRLRSLHDALAELATDLEAHALEPGLAACAARARSLAAAMRQIEQIDDAGTDGTVDTDGDDGAMDGARTLSSGPRGFSLSLLPYDVSTRFRNLVQQRPCAWVFTSATLAVADDFSHFALRLGLESAATLRLDSPFDYARQALLYLPRAMPEPSHGTFTDAVVDAAEPLIRAAGGGAFVLFTSHRALRQAALRLRDLLPAELPLLVQGEAPREQLLRRFRSSGCAVLLGAASFWEGVDVQGTALRLVVIDRLPFAAPDEPVVRARVEHLQAQGGNPFREYQLPEAVLALKQGAGRLIRSEQDRGVVAICDPRLMARGYGKVFLASLPPMPVTREAEPVLRFLRTCAPQALPV
ncbi:MAG: ATP-dependent DNA helicase [Steroidobacterales bacterium]